MDLSYWHNQQTEFASTYQLVLLNLAGCGQSGTNRIHWTIESFARDITAIIHNEKLMKVILVAHSMGGDYPGGRPGQSGISDRHHWGG
ncbi:MAG: alpha/beta hydrolase [Pedobacter sp.]|nr:MAG: alpha/beta hydrolase [Pedobacter sp.]